MENADRQFQISGLNFSYPQADQPALRELSLNIERGQFVVLCGPSGSGKTTLLRLLKPALAPYGQLSGQLLFHDQPLAELDARAQSSQIGFVMQSPENQLVTDKVWHELAFGLESLGTDQQTIRRRVAEMASFFGIEGWFHREVATLSGGQKQLLNLAAIMTMQPEVLLLDEPTGQLDPIAAGEFLSALAKINRELGVSVIISEHRLEEVFPLSDRALVLDQGRLIADGTPNQVGKILRDNGHSMFAAMPAPMRIWAASGSQLDCPVTVREGRQWLAQTLAERQQSTKLPQAPQPTLDKNSPAVELKELYFRYSKEGEDILRGLELRLYPGELLAVLGGNGAGKSTLLQVISGLLLPYRGQVYLQGSPADSISDQEKFSGLLGALPQNPQTLFVKKTLREDLLELLEELPLSKTEQQLRLQRVLRLCRLEQLQQRHPYDLSGGEQQRAALAKILLLQPRILLLDEPTKGLDADFKRVFAAILRQLLDEGVAILMVSHDVEFCAEYAQRCAFVFDGQIVSQAPARQFFSGNSFYTTAANRMARQLLPEAVTAGDIISALGGQQPPAAEIKTDDDDDDDDDISAKPAKQQGAEDSPTGDNRQNQDHFESTPAQIKPLFMSNNQQQTNVLSATEKTRRQRYRIILAIAAFLCAGALIALLLHEWSALPPWEEWTAQSNFSRQFWLYAGETLLALITLVCGFLLLRPRRDKDALPPEQPLSRRTKIAALLVLLLIPLTIFIGEYFLGQRKYLFISLLIMLEAMLPFALVFEGRKPQARELVTIAVLCAIAVAGRALLFMLPQVKPVLAMVIIAAVALGGETGFIVGAITALVSNFFLGQGPWTPWQMFTMGLIGFIAGILFRKGLLSRKPLPLAIFGAIATFFIYGGIMNPASLLMFQSEPTWEMLISYYALGMPMDIIHAASTFVFLLVLSRPFLEKLDRIKSKYGLLDKQLPVTKKATANAAATPRS